MRVYVTFLLMLFGVAFQGEAAHEIRTFCNPMSLENYPIGLPCRGYKNGDETGGNLAWKTPEHRVVQFREMADPTILCEKGVWYLYPSGDLCYRSDDCGATWKHIPLHLSGADGEEDLIGYAPTVCRHRGKVLLLGSAAHIFEGETPEGPFKDLGILVLPRTAGMGLCDPNLFSDDDGRLYFYWGCSPTNGIWGLELDAQNPCKVISEAKKLINFEPQKHPWEVLEGSNPPIGYLEGPWMLKHNGKYILTYAAGGTENRGYAMGQVVGDRPLGPFVKTKNNPFYRKTEGFVVGTSHGSVTKGPDGNYWVAYTINANRVHFFERRIGMDRIEFDADGTLKVSFATEEPQWLPAFGQGPTGWKRLPAVPQAGAEAATDLHLNTIWKTEKLPAVLTLDLGAERTLYAVRIAWYDCGLNTECGVKKGPYQYRLESRAQDGSWKTLLDASKNTRDLLIDYRETEPTKAKAVRLVVLGAPRGILPGIADCSLFGK